MGRSNERIERQRVAIPHRENERAIWMVQRERYDIGLIQEETK